MDLREAFEFAGGGGRGFLGSAGELGGVPDPQFVTRFREQALESANRPGGLDPHPHQTLQTPVESLRFAVLVIQARFS